MTEGGSEAREGRRRRWLPEPPRKPEGSEVRGARPRPERSEGLPACGAGGETSRGFAGRPQEGDGSPPLRRQTAGLPEPRRETRRGLWR